MTNLLSPFCPIIVVETHNEGYVSLRVYMFAHWLYLQVLCVSKVWQSDKMMAGTTTTQLQSN